VQRTIYPGRPDHPQAAIIANQMTGGGNVVAFDLGSRAAAWKFLDTLQIVRIQQNLSSVAGALRDMLGGTEPYPLPAWANTFARLRIDLEQALARERELAPAGRLTAEQARLDVRGRTVCRRGTIRDWAGAASTWAEGWTPRPGSKFQLRVVVGGQARRLGHLLTSQSGHLAPRPRGHAAVGQADSGRRDLSNATSAEWFTLPIVTRTGVLRQGVATPGWRQPWLVGHDRPTLEKQAGSSRYQRRRATPRSTRRASPPLASLTGVPLSSQETAASRAALNDHADEPRVAIVTGGSRGIGRQAVSRLAADGFAVVVGFAGNRDLAESAVKEVTAGGGRAVAVQADVADEQAVAALFATAESEYGGVDVVVHAAGRAHTASIADLDLADLATDIIVGRTVLPADQ
jgi:hypothetical protein